MGGAAGSGFLEGFTKTSLVLEKLKHERQKEQEELEVKKQDLALRRDILKGQEASRKFQDFQNQLNIEKMLREYGEQLKSQKELAGQPQGPAVAPQGAVPGVAPVLPQPVPAPDAALPDPGAFSQPIQVLPGTPNGTQAPAIVDPSLPDRAQPFNTPEYRAYLEKIGRGEDPGPPPRGATVVGRTSPQSAPVSRQPAVPLPDAGVTVTAPREAPLVTEDTLRLRGLQAERAQLEQSLQQLQTLRPRYVTKEGRAEIDKRIDDARQAILLKETQIGNMQTRATTEQAEALKAEKAREPKFDTDFESYFAPLHNGQRPADALKQPGGAAVVQQAQERYRAKQVEDDAQKAYLKELKTQPLALERVEAARAATPIAEAHQKSLTTHTSIFNSINKIEGIIQEVGDLPDNFINLVAENAPGINRYLQGDEKALTGLLKQYKTVYGAAASNDPRVNRFLSALGNMRDLIILERSGAAVTGTELSRAIGAFTGSLPNVNQAFALFAQNLANVKETVRNALVSTGASVRPLSGGDVVFEGLPEEVQIRILEQEQRAAARKRGEAPHGVRQGQAAKPPLALKPVSEMSPEEVQAEIERLERKAGGR